MSEPSDDEASATRSTAGGSVLRKVLGVGDEPRVLVEGEVLDGAYRIGRELGAGGMGVVYLARDVRIHRDVAVKLHTRAGIEAGTGKLLAEATALARLVHPNVVTVYQVGTHDGRLYVVMEYVDGGTAKSWLRAAPRGWREVVARYAAAGRGLAAAHAAGIVHRDFKPDNVLVGTDGRVRVADFGLARAVDEQDAEQAIAGTPAYMAPEQHRGGEIGPAADQFAFAVALWEALAGERPFAGERRHDLAAAIEAGRIREPPRPIPRHVRAALERALAAAPPARHPSMNALLAAIERDPRAGWRRAAITASAFALAGLGVAGAVTLAAREDPTASCAQGAHGLDGVWDAARRAELAAALTGHGDTGARVAARLDTYAAAWTAQRIGACRASRVRHEQSAALLDLRNHCLDRRRDALAALVDRIAVDPGAADGAMPAAVRLDALDDCADVPRLTGAMPLPDDTASRAAIGRAEATIADARVALDAGRIDAGLALANRALAAADASGYTPLIAEARSVVSRADDEAGDYDGARRAAQQAAVEAGNAGDDILIADIWSGQLQLLTNRFGKLSDAELLVPVAQAALARAGNPPLGEAVLRGAIGNLRLEQGRNAEAFAELRRALELEEDARGSDDVRLANVLGRLAQVEAQLGDKDAAVARLERAVALIETTYGPDHPHAAALLNNLALVLRSQGKYADAVAMFRRSLAAKERAVGLDHPSLIPVLGNLGDAERAIGEYDQGRIDQLRSLALAEAHVGADSAGAGRALHNLGVLDAEVGNLPEAEDYLTRALAVAEKTDGETSASVAQTLIMRAQVRTSLRRYDDARADLERAGRNLVASGAPPERIAMTMGALGDVLMEEGDLAGAIHEFELGVATGEQSIGPSAMTTAQLRVRLAQARLQHGDATRARSEAAAALEAMRAQLGDQNADVASAHLVVGECDEAVGHHRNAIESFERAVAIFEALGDPDDFRLIEPQSELAIARLNAGDDAGALAAGERALAIIALHPPPARQRIADADFVTAEALWRTGGDRSRATRLAREARAIYADLAPVNVPDVDRWLRQRR